MSGQTAAPKGPELAEDINLLLLGETGEESGHIKMPGQTAAPKGPELAEDINLLLLGETGVDKCIFINSISNCFKYTTFANAQKEKIEILVPVCLQLANGEKICGDPDKNKIHSSGGSHKEVKVLVYTFPLKVDKKMFNLKIVDTPGVGDPRGKEQDDMHIDNILAYLATLKKLHGICFVIQANESRLNTFTQYCLKQILTRLDKSASDNIIFITTDSKNSQYAGKKTKFHILKPLVNDIKSKPPYVDIHLSDKNLFSLDNEGFKALLEMQGGMKFSKHDIEGFSKSWTVAVKEYKRLFSYITGDSKNRPLKPHVVENTIKSGHIKMPGQTAAPKGPELAEDINLLLLGETGVGKSTFINSISNYFKYTKFSTAQKGKIDILVPVCLQLSDGEKICGDPDRNEIHSSGGSHTQQVKVYTFPLKVGKKMFNLKIVDTPGVGDPRGIEQDNIHIDNILAYLATLKKLHGICFVIKANESRLNNFIKYCSKQILIRLDKSASDNIIFITTYSKTSQYTGKETKYHILKPLVNDIKSKRPYVDIPLSDKNVFSLDNEAFKALLEVQEDMKFSKHDMKGFTKSWAVSVKEYKRLFTYIIGDSKNRPLKPHDVENTISINEVRFLIEQLATPIAEVSEVLQHNLILLDRHKKTLNLKDKTLNELKEQLYIPFVKLEVTELNGPITVCTDAKCREIFKVNGVTQWHYRKICHDRCALQGVQKEMIGDPRLTGCLGIGIGRINCQKCGCNWKLHMHMYKLTQKVNEQKVDENVLGDIKNMEDARVETEALIKEINQRMQEMEAENEIISTSIAKFSSFLQEHALTPYNDAYCEYIKQIITIEKACGKHANQDLIEKHEKLLKKHEYLMKTFQDNERKFQSTGGQSNLTVAAIKESIIDLYVLKHTGAKIKELMRKKNSLWEQRNTGNF